MQKKKEERSERSFSMRASEAGDDEMTEARDQFARQAVQGRANPQIEDLGRQKTELLHRDGLKPSLRKTADEAIPVAHVIIFIQKGNPVIKKWSQIIERIKGIGFNKSNPASLPEQTFQFFEEGTVVFKMMEDEKSDDGIKLPIEMIKVPAEDLCPVSGLKML